MPHSAKHRATCRKGSQFFRCYFDRSCRVADVDRRVYADVRNDDSMRALRRREAQFSALMELERYGGGNKSKVLCRDVNLALAGECRRLRKACEREDKGEGQSDG